MKRRALFIFLLVGLLGGLAWYLFHQPPEPVYQGKPLHEWLALYNPSMGSHLGPDPAVDDAIRHIGSNAIPTLLEMIQEQDSSVRLKWIELLWKRHIFSAQQSALRNFQAVLALRALGPAASNAVPTLVRVYRRNISAWSQEQTFAVLQGIGPAAFPAANSVFLDALSSTNTFMRGQAAITIYTIHSQPEVFVPALVKALKDSDPGVRDFAFLALGAYGPSAKSTVPALIDLYKNDPDQSVRSVAAFTLEQIDPQAASAVGIK